MGFSHKITIGCLWRCMASASSLEDGLTLTLTRFLPTFTDEMSSSRVHLRAYLCILILLPRLIAETWLMELNQRLVSTDPEQHVEGGNDDDPGGPLSWTLIKERWKRVGLIYVVRPHAKKAYHRTMQISCMVAALFGRGPDVADISSFSSVTY